MNSTTTYLKNLFEHIKLDHDSADFFITAYKKINADTSFKSIMNESVTNYLNYYDNAKSESILSDLAVASGYHINSLFMLMLLIASEELRGMYLKENIHESIFWNTVTDFRCKINECVECKGYPGTFVGYWFADFFKLKRFSVGRFQFELSKFNSEKSFECNGMTLLPQATVVNLHVPSTGIPLTDEVRFESYRSGYNFMIQRYGEFFPNGIMPYTCCSWLLHSINKEILPPWLNILKYAGDFSVIWENYHDSFINGWRVFGRYADLPTSQLPRKTSLQAAYADHLQKGGQTGEGYGVFLFDGKKIYKNT